MMWGIIAVVITILIIAAVCALIYSRIDPVRPDPRELTDEQIEQLICGTATEAPRRGV